MTAARRAATARLPKFAATAFAAAALVATLLTAPIGGSSAAAEDGATNPILAGTTLSGVMRSDADRADQIKVTAKVPLPAGRSAASITYQWLRDGATITNATKNFYFVKPGSQQRRISVLVTDTLDGSSTEISTITTSVNPVIGGKTRVGETLTAYIDSTKHAVAYRWYRDGVRIGGDAAAGADYTVKVNDLGAQLSVMVTQSSEGLGSLVETSESTAPITVNAFAALKPTITGTPKHGKTLKVGRISSSAGTVTVVWLRDGKVISGATGPSYKPVLKDLDTRLSARVTQSRNGYTTRTETTAKTKKITSPRYLTAATPKVSGTVKVGTKLTAKRGTWTKGTKFTYQWYASGKKIKGATKKTFTVTKAQRGKIVKVKVTGTKPKYEVRAVSSAPAKIAGIRGPRNENGWAWPTDTRELNQGYHEGYAIDLGTTAGGPVFAPYKGEVVQVGGDGWGKPSWCPTAWWHGENQTVVIKHSYEGKTIYSAVNHVARGSSKALGITVGTKVKSGQQIATEGMSGCTSGPHIHFVMRKTQFNWNGELKPDKYIGKPDPVTPKVYVADLPVLPVREDLLS
ncbi:peptidoglycan DD-metalloendopeptidase family protein [Leucobacter soli]|uniref:M23ase beta-sheet core domain-containing protein n=1 Tax=Leucobacter soli TaxID=2812850 RepID=A0A916JXG0_9MICO|nr:peptidoglycan DD-metalloendopeptidase family protein [Leucobacter soli]CAG7608474.1 hypothetical protein LEUCIP111803_01120 [Leucobacter soli]